MSILDLASHSIPEPEYNLERKEINYALSEGVIATDKRKPPFRLLSGDSYFFNFLNSKVRLTELGLYILGSIKGEPTRFEHQWIMPINMMFQCSIRQAHHSYKIDI